jgi:predicted Rossmann-fold nucleotide-binding protein
MWTWAQLGIHRKPCGLLNVGGYFDGLLTFLDHAVQERFLRLEHRAMVLVDDNAERLLHRLETFRPPDVPKWIDLDQA